MEVGNISQSIEAMSDILEMAAEQSTNLAEKLVKMNVENTIDVLKDEMIGNAIDILV
jgi:hypothetical protein